jgi:hypothetical protein
MDTNQFDALSRAVGSRRGILAGALGGVTLLGLGHAVGAKRRRRRRKKICKKKKIKVSCVDSCRFFNISNCRKFDVQCKCPRGKSCLANDSCGLSCAAADCPEGSGCTCSTSDPKVCLAAFTTCEDVPTSCASTADCPFRFFCDETPCGEGGATEKRCLPLCGYAAVP